MEAYLDEQKLRTYFQFDEGDLEFNRKGDFSEKQMGRFRSRQNGRMRSRRNAALALLVIGIILLGLAAIPLFTREVILPAVIILSFFGVSILLVGLYLLRSSAFQQNYLFRRAQGPVAIVKEWDVYEGHPYERYEMYVGGQSFAVDEQLMDLMKQGEAYTVYYAEGSVTELTEIVAVEAQTRG